jgi:hypothetical protein
MAQVVEQAVEGEHAGLARVDEIERRLGAVGRQRIDAQAAAPTFTA